MYEWVLVALKERLSIVVGDRKKIPDEGCKGVNVSNNLSNCHLIKSSVGGELILRYKRVTRGCTTRKSHSTPNHCLRPEMTLHSR